MKRPLTLLLVALLPLAVPAPAPAQSKPPAPVDHPTAATTLKDLASRVSALKEQTAKLAEAKATWKYDIAAAAQIDRRLIGLERGSSAPAPPPGAAAAFKPILGPPGMGPVLAAMKASCEGFGGQRESLRRALRTGSPTTDPYNRYPDMYRAALKELDTAFTKVLTATDVAAVKIAIARLDAATTALSKLTTAKAPASP